MITSFAAFLESLQAKEAAILAEENVKHAPTIGDMYEGLTKELLERAIPPNLGLRLVDGFVIGVDGKPGNQIDALGRWRTASAFAAGGDASHRRLPHRVRGLCSRSGGARGLLES